MAQAPDRIAISHLRGMHSLYDGFGHHLHRLVGPEPQHLPTGGGKRRIVATIPSYVRS
jgi:hypothetical protein